MPIGEPGNMASMFGRKEPDAKKKFSMRSIKVKSETTTPLMSTLREESTDGDSLGLDSSRTLHMLLGQDDRESEIGIQHLLQFLVVDVEKRTHLRHFIRYIVFFVAITMLIVSRCPSVKYSDALQQTTEVKQTMLLAELQQVDTDKEMWAYLHNAFRSVWRHALKASCKVDNGATPQPTQGPTPVPGPTVPGPQPTPTSPVAGGRTATATATATAQAMATPTATLTPSMGATPTAVPPQEPPSKTRTAQQGTPSATLPPPPQEECDAKASGRKMMSLGAVLLRQWRVKYESCQITGANTVKAIAPCLRHRLPCRCAHQFKESTMTSEAFGGETGKLYQSDRESGFPLHPVPVVTARQSYEDLGHQFSMYFNLDDNIDAVLKNLTNLEKGGWVDEATRLVSLDVLFFNPDSESFVRSACYVEYFQTGGSEGDCYLQHPFILETLGYDVMTVCSMITFAFLPLLAVHIVDTCWVRIEIKRGWLVLVELYEVLHFCVVVALCYYRALMWTELYSIVDDNYYPSLKALGLWGGFGEQDSTEAHIMFHTLSRYSVFYKAYNEVLAFCVVLSWLRVFIYIQHIQQVNMLSETIKHAVGDVLRLAVIFLYCLFAFSFALCLLFSSESDEFETILHSASLLLRALFFEHEPNYPLLRKMEPFWAPTYTVAFYVLCYFLILNMVIAVIVSSFAAVQVAQETAMKQLEHREEQRIDEEIERMKSGTAAVILASQAVKANLWRRFNRWAASTARGVAKEFKAVFHTDNKQRKRAFKLAKEYCAEKLRTSEDVLRLKPEYFKRVNISKGDLKKKCGKLLSDDDLEAIFLGVQRKEIQEENQLLLITQYVAAMYREMRRRLAAREAPQQRGINVTELHESLLEEARNAMRKAQAERDAADRDLAALRHNIASLQRQLQQSEAARLDAEHRYLTAQLAHEEVASQSYRPPPNPLNRPASSHSRSEAWR